MALGPYWNLRVDRFGRVFVITMQKAPENRLNVRYAQEIIRALRDIERALGPDSEGCVITRGNDEKFWCTGLELDEADTNPFANSDGFYPLLATFLDYPFPTIALLTGHTFGGACPFSLAHDYRIMNSNRGFFSMPPVNLGLHFPGIGFLPRLKLRPQIARKMLLEAHRWTGKEALEDGIVDEVVEPGPGQRREKSSEGLVADRMLEAALKKARSVEGRAKMGVYSLLRNELWGEAGEQLRRISYVHGKVISAPAKARI
ncbi:ClpP/crotonase [Zopfia rhizophila CBS 207.26]|uniref:ClpP/crotonase n=1 Tax=Zopfia rhizophila CBS 207.26 TaxID=1314779 RepID=A0A6A6E6V1_9PEZI|nr:ClpP/crotonase [Zopfia rhizophila CBS 207.26]